MLFRKCLSAMSCLSLSLSLLLAAGCTDPSASPSGATAGSSAGGAAEATHDHDHPAEGPHHGHLIELGSDEYHAELVHDQSSVTIYLLDGAAQKPVAIDSPEITINLKHDGRPEQFRLAASPEAGDPDGKSSRFVSQDAELAGHLDDEAAAPRLSVMINGTPYSGALSHSHAEHGEHDHSHADDAHAADSPHK